MIQINRIWATRGARMAEKEIRITFCRGNFSGDNCMDDRGWDRKPRI